MKPYAISRYLSEEEKQAMVAAVYSHRVGPVPPTAERECPLAIALNATGQYPTFAPCAFRVAAELTLLGRGDTVAIERAAAAFIRKWDNGELASARLAAALGVKP